MTDLRDLRTLRQFAEAFPGFTRRYLYYLIRSNAAFNELAVVRVGKKIFLDAAGVQRWVEQHRPRVPGRVNGGNDGGQEASRGRIDLTATTWDLSELTPESWHVRLMQPVCQTCRGPLASPWDQCPTCHGPTREG